MIVMQWCMTKAIQLFLPTNPLLFQVTNLSNKITYNNATGDFYVPEEGIYNVHWWINARNANSDENTTVNLKTLGVEFHQYWPERCVNSSFIYA